MLDDSELIENATSKLCSPRTADDRAQKKIMMTLTKSLFDEDLNPNSSLREMCERFQALSTEKEPFLRFSDESVTQMEESRVSDSEQLSELLSTGFNPAIRAFGQEVQFVVARAMRDAAVAKRGVKKHAHTLVSVGSGNGCVEEVLETMAKKWFPEHFKDWEIVGIDPDKFGAAMAGGKVCWPPQFSSIEEYRERTGRDGADVLLINWPDPDNEGYDFDAIMDLLPSQLVLVHASDETSGSQKLHFLFNQQPETFGYELVENHAKKVIVTENEKDREERRRFEESHGFKHDPDRHTQTFVYRLQRYKQIDPARANFSVP
jgi:hypothetical protein